MYTNLALISDSYKYSHYKQYPVGTTNVYSYFESRGSDLGTDEIVFFGLQGILKEYLQNPVSPANVREAKELVDSHMLPYSTPRDGYTL